MSESKLPISRRSCVVALADRAGLRIGHSERQARKPRGGLPGAALDGDSRPLCRAFPFQAQRQFKGEQLIERE